jgi:hypothetical protein
MNPELLQRAGQLAASGMKKHSIMKRLKREFPNQERLDIHIAAGLGPTGIMPDGARLRPVIVRRDPRKNVAPQYMTEAEADEAIAKVLEG